MTSPFDPALSTTPTRRISVCQLVDLLNVTHAPGRIESYRQAMRAGDRFPPISVVRLGRRYVVADGHKRLVAVKALGEEHIDVEVWSPWRLTRDLAGQSARHARSGGQSARRRLPRRRWPAGVVALRHRDRGPLEAHRALPVEGCCWRAGRADWDLRSQESTGRTGDRGGKLSAEPLAILTVG